MNDNKKLNFDLDFLEKPTPTTLTGSNNSFNNNSVNVQKTKKSYGWIISLVIIGGLILLGIVNSNSQQTVSIDGYSCSQDNATKAKALRPDPNTKSELVNQYNQLNNEKSSLNQYDQSQVDQYNSEVATYNVSKDTYNNQLDSYNNFLTSNCTQQTTSGN